MSAHNDPFDPPPTPPPIRVSPSSSDSESRHDVQPVAGRLTVVNKGAKVPDVHRDCISRFSTACYAMRGGVRPCLCTVTLFAQRSEPESRCRAGRLLPAELPPATAELRAQSRAGCGPPSCGRPTAVRTFRPGPEAWGRARCAVLCVTTVTSQPV